MEVSFLIITTTGKVRYTIGTSLFTCLILTRLSAGENFDLDLALDNIDFGAYVSLWQWQT